MIRSLASRVQIRLGTDFSVENAMQNRISIIGRNGTFGAHIARPQTALAPPSTSEFLTQQLL